MSLELACLEDTFAPHVWRSQRKIYDIILKRNTRNLIAGVYEKSWEITANSVSKYHKFSVNSSRRPFPPFPVSSTTVSHRRFMYNGKWYRNTFDSMVRLQLEEPILALRSWRNDSRRVSRGPPNKPIFRPRVALLPYDYPNPWEEILEPQELVDTTRRPFPELPCDETNCHGPKK